jgi:hypothetical protein
MPSVFIDSELNDFDRRTGLYRGDLFVFTPRASTLALVDHARSMIEEALPGLDPLRAQHAMAVERYVEIMAPLKPAFIHHPRTKELIRDLVEDLGCSLENTFLDVPRLRMVTSDGYLTAGIGYAHHPHRDTWYSAPQCQLNWWIPLWDIQAESALAFHPAWFDRPIKNSSSDFNYYRWNSEGRKNAAQHIKQDTRNQPKPLEPIDLGPELRVVLKAGGIVLFSPVQLHSTVPNTTGLTRYSLDFRTVALDDVLAGRGAPNVDAACTGTSLRDFKRGSDLAPLPEEQVARYDSGSEAGGMLVFTPALERAS